MRNKRGNINWEHRVTGRSRDIYILRFIWDTTYAAKGWVGRKSIGREFWDGVRDGEGLRWLSWDFHWFYRHCRGLDKPPSVENVGMWLWLLMHGTLRLDWRAPVYIYERGTGVLKWNSGPVLHPLFGIFPSDFVQAKSRNSHDQGTASLRLPQYQMEFWGIFLYSPCLLEQGLMGF